MRRFICLILVTLVLTPLTALAQPGAPNPPGQTRVIGRSWLTPLETAFATATPGADPASGTFSLNLFVTAFTDPSAAEDWFGSAATTTKQQADQVGQSSRPLDLLLPADQATLFYSTEQQGDRSISGVLGVIRRDNLIISVASQHIGMNRAAVTDEIGGLLTTMLGNEPGPGPELFRADGSSRGGLWELFRDVSPAMIPGSSVTDLDVFSAGATPAPDPSDVRLNDLVAPADLVRIRGVHDVRSANWSAHETAATPATGMVSADAWIVTTDAPSTAGFVLFPLADILTRDLTVKDVVTETTPAGDALSTWTIYDVAAGRAATMIVRQQGADLYAILVTGDGSDAAAASLMEQMVRRGGFPPASAPELRGLAQDATPATPVP